jgi:Endo-alpha-N-acetylgalactosaminidase
MKIPFLVCLLFILAGTASGQKATFSGHKAALSGRQASGAGPVVLHSGDLLVKIGRENGLPYQYLYKNAPIRGVDSAHQLQVVLCRLKPRSYLTLAIAPAGIHSTAGEADVHYIVSYQRQPAASFHLRYKLNGSSLVITMEHVEEREGFELIETSMPDLATVREEDGVAWLAQGTDGGGVVELKHACSYHLEDHGYFGRIGYVLPMAIVGTDKVECVMEVSAFMDGTEIEVVGNEKHHHARIGTDQVYRVHGGRSYGMNDGDTAVGGNEITPNLIVGQMPRCRLDFVADADGNGSVDWLDGAKLLARRMPPTPTTYYNDKFVYIVGGKYKLEKEPRTSFAQSAQLIRDIAMLTDYAPQVPLISGWVYDGQDTGFPSEDSVNATLGGYDGLIHLMNEGKEYNANVTLNTNYDDAYKSSPIFDTAFIARRPDGRVWKSRDWAGDTSYVVGMAKFMETRGTPRIDYMMQHYPIHDALLIDAMSWFAIRNDWDPVHPASGYKNLTEGKYKIIEEFRKRGVQVISEQLRYPFIGKLPVSADGIGGGEGPFGGQPIPFVAAIYRKSAIWGAGDFSPDNAKGNFFWNCRPMRWFTNSSDRNSIADYYYMTVLPFNTIHNRSIELYEANGFRCRIGLGDGSNIRIDWMKDDYSIEVDGVEIAGHNATFCPVGKDRVACYARQATDLNVALPVGWAADQIVARALYVDHREPVAVHVEEGKIHLSVTAGRPVMIYRNAVVANSKHL